ncbi:MAG: rod shape-determining protein MreD [Candidatus Omnitrophica bacterium]|nr:rod shape-determining protein MreD [Candidatus Omnitrophota bacterium]
MPRIFSAKVIFYLLLLALLDLSLRPLIWIGAAAPMFLYLMIPYAIFQWKLSRSMTLAALIGIFRDLTGSHLLGLETLVLLLVTFLFDLLAQKVERNSNLMRFAGTFLFILSVFGALAAASGIFGSPAPISGYVFTAMTGTAFYTACLSLPFFALTTHWFHDRVPLKQYELFG